MLIGLSGYAGSGKDAAGQILISRHRYKRLAFADPLKDIARRLHYWSGDKDELGRTHLQHLGQVVREELGADVWVNATMRHAINVENVVITDVRYPNEAEAIRAAGGVLWRITRPGVRPANGHISESALDGFDFDARIANDGTLHDLATRVRAELLRAGSLG